MNTASASQRRKLLIALEASALSIIFVVFCAVTISAQDAIVVDIPPADALKMMTLYDQQKKIEAEIKSERRRIGLEYATWNDNYSVIDKDGKVPPEYEFSADFRHIVPKRPATIQSNCWSGTITSPALTQYNSTGSTGPDTLEIK